MNALVWEQEVGGGKTLSKIMGCGVQYAIQYDNNGAYRLTRHHCINGPKVIGIRFRTSLQAMTSAERDWVKIASKSPQEKA